ncbi:BsaA family SipW-dependent biofilm matrix protein [Clostridium transplantifaecale]|uniref:BsaA family SipW-dependent biofilm matrix protein n=1 Tax=Clostridium transplantifaecale TaxID=2479838 RepID=UPI000F62F2DA|nr:BsaA family SipW-dependent biofilm matrix protein [Clostridium transplantifaecale]
MKKSHKKIVALLAGFLCLAAVGTSMASYTNMITIKNPFSTEGPSGVILAENFNPDSTFLPGETVQKQPYFKNTGDVDLIVRVQVKERWKDGEGKTVSDENNPDAPNVDAVTKSWTDSWKNDWVEIGSYYYYKHILTKADGAHAKTPVILSELKLSNQISNDAHGINYSGLVYELNFDAEAVPADKLSVAVWQDELNVGSAQQVSSLDWSNLLQ